MIEIMTEKFVCEICGVNEAMRESCTNCDRYVCEDCFNDDADMCVNCAEDDSGSMHSLFGP
jgi:hypothetical protein